MSPIRVNTGSSISHTRAPSGLRRVDFAQCIRMTEQFGVFQTFYQY